MKVTLVPAYTYFPFKGLLIFILMLLGSIQANCQLPAKIYVDSKGKATFIQNEKRLSTQGLHQPDSSQQLLPLNNLITANDFNFTTAVTHPGCGYGNGMIIVTPTGGTAPYTFAVNTWWYILNTGCIAGLKSGDYTITIRDALGKVAITPVITLIDIPSAPKITIGQTVRPSGCLASDGSLEIVMTGGTPPYEYSIDQVNYQTSNVFSNLSYGMYTFFARDANGCTTSYWDLSLLELLKPMACEAGFGLGMSWSECEGNGYIEIDGAGLNPPYTYSVDGINFTSNNLFLNLSYGVHKIWLKDALGNLRIVAVAIYHDCRIYLDFIKVEASCGESDGEITIHVKNGFPPYTYSMDGINYQTSNNFTGLRKGLYSAMAKDASGEILYAMAEVLDKCPQVSAVTTPESCARNDGSVIATPSNGTSPYVYSIDGINFQASEIFSGLPAGDYVVTIKDALNNISTATAKIDFRCLTVEATVTDVFCANENGSIKVIASGGTSPYRYSIDGINFQFSDIFSGLSGGNYTVTVKDGMNVTSSKPVVIKNIPVPAIELAGKPATCSNDNGTITITNTSGIAPFTYSIDGVNYQSNNIFIGLSANSYTGYVKDANNCISSNSTQVVLNCPIITFEVTKETCNTKNGTIKVAVSNTNGFGPFTYSLNAVDFQASPVFSVLQAGDYTVTIKDRLGYLHTASTTIASSCPTMSVVQKAAVCGKSNGVIKIDGQGGGLPYRYSMNGIDYYAGSEFTDISAGTYNVYLKDADGITISTQVTVDNIPGPALSVSASPSTCINNDGAVKLIATMGTAPYQFRLDGGDLQTNNIFNTLSAGDYKAVVKDANGCEVSQPVSILTADNLTLNTGTEKLICEGTKAVLNTISNGTNFTWWPAVKLSSPTAKEPEASPEVTTKYYVEAKLGVCTKIDSFVVKVNPAPFADAGNNAEICFGNNAMLKGSGGIIFKWMPSAYLSDPAIASPTIVKPQVSTSYNLTVTDINGCMSRNAAVVKIKVLPPPKIFAGNDSSVAIGQVLQLKARDVNNAGFIEYKWSPSTNLNNDRLKEPFAILQTDINYTVKGITRAGCEGTDQVNIKVFRGPSVYVPSAFTPNGDGLNDIVFAKPIGFKNLKTFTIYNRYGVKIFSTSNALIGWDGKFKQTQQETGVYTWLAVVIDLHGKEVVVKGTIMLLR